MRGRLMVLASAGCPNVVDQGLTNSATATVDCATVAGGRQNEATTDFASVGGGVIRRAATLLRSAAAKPPSAAVCTTV